MTQQVFHCRVQLPYIDTTQGSVSQDFTIEQLGTDTDLVPSTVAALIESYYNSTFGASTNAVSYYLSPALSRASNAALIDMYDITAHLDGSPAGSPVYVAAFTLGSGYAGSPMPEGVALLTRYRADYGGDSEYGPGTRPRSRDRGRLYSPPLNNVLMESVTASHQFVFSDTALNDFEVSLGSIVQYGATADVPSLVQWSRAAARVQHIDTDYVIAEPRAAYQRRRDQR